MGPPDRWKQLAKLPHTKPTQSALNAFRGAPMPEIGLWRTAIPAVGT